MDGNTSWESLVVWDRSWLVVLLTMSSSHLELFILRPTEDSPFQMMIDGSITEHGLRVTTDTSIIKVLNI